MDPSPATARRTARFGAPTPSFRTYTSWGPNGSYSRLIGAHTVKVGANYRRLGVYLLSRGNSAGSFNFDREFTSSTGAEQQQHHGRQRLRDASCSGIRAAIAGLLSTMTLSTPLDVYTNYYGGYAQDDWRVSSDAHGDATGSASSTRMGFASATTPSPSVSIPSATNALSAITIPASVDPTGGTPARMVTGRTDVRRRRRQQGLSGESARASPVASDRHRQVDQSEDCRSRRVRIVPGALDLSHADER
mgnify:CR=1 FL=1